LTTRPKTVFFPSIRGTAPSVITNIELLVFGPEHSPQ
jgi:hypothetical protein